MIEPTAATCRALCTARFHAVMESAVSRPWGNGTMEGGSEVEPAVLLASFAQACSASVGPNKSNSSHGSGGVGWEGGYHERASANDGEDGTTGAGSAAAEAMTRTAHACKYACERQRSLTAEDITLIPTSHPQSLISSPYDGCVQRAERAHTYNCAVVLVLIRTCQRSAWHDNDV